MRRDLPVEGAISNPSWTQLPNGDDFSRFYPPLAAFLGLSGRAMIGCVVTSAGALADCSTETETPAGFGFGAAAIQMTPMFHMKPQTLDGVPVGGARVRIPLRFLPPEPPPAAPASEPAAAPSASAMALAHRLATEIGSGELDALVKAAVEQMRQSYGSAGMSREQQIALDSFELAMSSALPARIDRVARFYASTIPEPQLAEIVAFLERPAGRTWIATVAQAQQFELSDSEQIQRIITADARARLCRQITCLASDTPAPAATPAPK